MTPRPLAPPAPFACQPLRTLLLLLLPLALAPLRAGAEEASLCGPFEPVEVAQLAPELREQGVTAVREQGVTSASDPGAGPGSIVRLPAAGAGDADPSAGAAGDEAASEALLALPKNAAGEIPTDFELGPDARISESFFSPVICATIAKVAGPPGAPIGQLVTVVPEGAALVRNDVYASAAGTVRPVEREASPEARPDPYTPLQYGLAVTGVRAARALGTGEGVRIALLDSAPAREHRDLSATRIRPIARAGQATTKVGVHGTLMAGVIAAIENNGFGIAGLAPDAEVVAIPVCTPSGAAGGRCTIFDLLQGLDEAWDVEAQIVNLSLSGPPNVLLERGVARLEALGAVVVAAAGNEGTREERYPAAYPTVIGVGAVDRDGRPFAAGNAGPWVELAAPGVDVLSTVPGDAFAFGNGTSLAAAHVTGALAILTGITRDARLARGELFRTVNSGTPVARPPGLPEVCDVLARLEVDCDAPPPSSSSGAADAARPEAGGTP